MKFILKFISVFLIVLVLPFQSSSSVFAQAIPTGQATFTINPDSGTFSDTFSVGLFITTGPNTKVVTLRADVIYPQEKLQVVSVETDTSTYFIPQKKGTWINKGDFTTTGGDIVFAASISDGATTEGQPFQLAKINFKVLSTGAATISFGNSSAIYLYQSGATTPTNIYQPKLGASYVLANSTSSTTTNTPTPTPTTVSSGNLTNAGNEMPTFALLFAGVVFLLLGSKKLLFSSL